MRLNYFLLGTCTLSLWVILGVGAEGPIFSPVQKHPIEDKGMITSQEKEVSKADDEPGPDYRLPSSLIPQNYFLRIRPIIDRDHPGVGNKDIAHGLVRIRVQCVESTSRVVMHQKFLTINESAIGIRNLEDNAVVGVSSVEYDEARDFLIINLTAELTPPNSYEISIGYWANVPPNDSLRGLYSEAYFDPLTNQTKVMAATQLEPLRARQVFPSLDEPSYKATFDVVIGRTENFTSLGNSPLIDTQPDVANPGWFWDTYNTTVPMPTYLFAMAVSDYSFNEASSDLYRLPVRVYGPRHLTNEGKAQISANGSAMLMDHFERKYGIPHNMPKVDSISVPYKRGAMENYGLITYGEYLLMYHEGITLHTELRQIYHILAHELGHQWFGNLVTCKWWSDIWLNEGFATYVSFEGVQALWPRFDMMNFMIHDTVNSALIFDATAASHPIHQEAYNAEQIGVNMDTIGYDKGGSIVRLMVSFLGEETFYTGIRRYLNLLQDQVAEQDDLFEALNYAANSNNLNLPKNVTEIMHTWTLQTGFPLVQVQYREVDNSLVFSQDAWQNADVRNKESSVVANSSWDIPVKYLVENGQDSGQEGSLWLLQAGDPENVTLQNGSGWILTNPDAGGYYRTLYDNVLVGRIREQLARNHTVFPVAARIRLLDDQLTLGFQKYVPIGNSLEITKYLANETDPTVWFSTFSNLLKLRMLWGRYTRSSHYEALSSYLLPRVDSVREQVEQIIRKNPLEASAESILYSQLVDWSCELGSNWCAEYTTQLFEEWTSSPGINPVPVNLQSTLYCKMVEMDQGQGPAYNWILEQYKLPGQSRIQKTRLATALGCFTENSNVAIDLGRTRNGIEAVDSVALLQRVLIHTHFGRNTTLTILVQANDWIQDYGWTASELVQVISVGANYFAVEVETEYVERIRESNEDIFQDSLNSTIDAVRANVAWMAEFGTSIPNWFNDNSK